MRLGYSACIVGATLIVNLLASSAGTQQYNLC
jgi:hypothetical protein